MSIQAHPFLWGKSEKFHGWNCIAQPEFLRGLEGPASRILEEAQAGIELSADQIRIVRGDPNYGVLDIVYRRVPSSYTEKGGRPFAFIEGLVLRERYDPFPSFSSKDFDTARTAIQPQYEKFLNADSWSEAASWHNVTIDIDGLPQDPPLEILEANSRFLPLVAEETRPRSPSGNRLAGNSTRKQGKQAPPDFLEKKIAEYASKTSGRSDDYSASQPEPLHMPSARGSSKEQQDILKILLILAAAGGVLFVGFRSLTALVSFIAKKR